MPKYKNFQLLMKIRPWLAFQWTHSKVYWNPRCYTLAEQIARSGWDFVRYVEVFLAGMISRASLSFSWAFVIVSLLALEMYAECLLAIILLNMSATLTSGVPAVWPINCTKTKVDFLGERITCKCSGKSALVSVTTEECKKTMKLAPVFWLNVDEGAIHEIQEMCRVWSLGRICVVFEWISQTFYRLIHATFRQLLHSHRE